MRSRFLLFNHAIALGKEKLSCSDVAAFLEKVTTSSESLKTLYFRISTIVFNVDDDGEYLVNVDVSVSKHRVHASENEKLM